MQAVGSVKHEARIVRRWLWRLTTSLLTGPGISVTAPT
jgi:hypothetical protein